MSDSEEETAEKPLKLVMVGDGTCGKTSLVKQFIHGNMNKDYDQTMGVEFHLKHVELPGSKVVAVQVWDIGGQTLGGMMLDKYIYGSHGVLLVYDITNQNSFDNLEDWLETVRGVVRTQGPLPHMALIANKCDKEHTRIVRTERHNRFSQINSLSSYLVSAKTGESVNLCFQRIVADILGVRLNKLDMEQQQPVVKAEILQNSEDANQDRASTAVRTGVCVLQ